MGKRCLTINNGQPCVYLAMDGTCLLDEEAMKYKCPARERVCHEEKDEWMARKRI